jgi:hypothetical protein
MPTTIFGRETDSTLNAVFKTFVRIEYPNKPYTSEHVCIGTQATKFLSPLFSAVCDRGLWVETETDTIIAPTSSIKTEEQKPV